MSLVLFYFLVIKKTCIVLIPYNNIKFFNSGENQIQISKVYQQN